MTPEIQRLLEGRSVREIDSTNIGKNPVHDIRASRLLVRGEGLRVQLERIPGETARHVLSSPFGFPAVLNDFEWEEEFGHEEYETIQDGEFSQPIGGDGYHGRRLKRLDLESLAMECDADWLTHGGYSLDDVETTLENIGRAKTPFRFIARIKRGGDAAIELRMDATLRRIRPTLHPGQRQVRYWSLSFVEWRDASISRRRARDPGRGRPGNLPRKHKLKAGDTLHSLSMQFYGTYDNWDVLRTRNGLGKWGMKTPIVESKKFKVGQTFLIPEVQMTARFGKGRVTLPGKPGWSPASGGS